MAKIDKKEKAESADHPPLPKIRLESANEIVGKVVFEIRNCQMNIPKIRERYKTIPPVTKNKIITIGVSKPREILRRF